MESAYIVPILIGIIIILIILLVFKESKHKKTINIKNLQNISNENLEEIMKKHNISPDMMNSASSITTSSTVTQVKYVNGQKVSEETKTFHNQLSPITNCPNCGANIEKTATNICPYCNTSFEIYQSTNK